MEVVSPPPPPPAPFCSVNGKGSRSPEPLGRVAWGPGWMGDSGCGLCRRRACPDPGHLPPPWPPTPHPDPRRRPQSSPSASGHAVGLVRSRPRRDVCSGFDKVISEAGPKAARWEAPRARGTQRGPPADAAPDGCPAVDLCLGTWFLLNLIASFSGLKSRVASKPGQQQFNLIARRWPSEGTVATGAHPGPAPPRLPGPGGHGPGSGLRSPPTPLGWSRPGRRPPLA